MQFPDPTSPDLATWLNVELAVLTAPHEPGENGPTRALRRDALLSEDSAVLRATHRRLVEDEVTPQAGATYISGWFGGGAARLVGLGLASAGAGLLLDPDEVVFDLVPDGWPEQVRPGRARVVVAPGHPWAGQPDVEVTEAEQVVPRTMATLVDFVTPVVEACRTLARVSKVGLWDEVPDGLVGAVAYVDGLKVTPEAEAVVLAATQAPAMPWKARPRLVWADSAVLGRILIAQKGGCCLAFTNKREPAAEAELSPPMLDYRRRFGLDRAGKRYCTTCCFRDPEDVVERRVAWAEIRHLHGVK